MSAVDWTIMLGTIFAIVGYGTWVTRKSRNIENYLLGGKSDKWWTIGLSVMATQASAITFLSTPGQAYHEGMGFVQFYFGLPIAMVIIAFVFIPLYYRLKVYTAYEFLEARFDLKTRVFTAFLFLLSRGLAAGITIYAPAIILSQILGWSLNFTCIFIGMLVIIYTVTGGTKAVSVTHKQQMAVIFLGLVITFGLLIYYLNDFLSIDKVFRVAGKMGKMEVVDTSFNPDVKYNLWSGLIGGLFLQLSYFGTDQSQVQRYLSGHSIKESRLGLLFNGLVKIPMQFFILLTGVLVFMFYQFNKPPVFFNQVSLQKVEQSVHADSLRLLDEAYSVNFEDRRAHISDLAKAMDEGQKMEEEQRALRLNMAQADSIRQEVAKLIKRVDPADKTVNGGQANDYDYVFITFIMNYLPIGVIGLLLAMIFSGAMSSTSAELNALASTTTVDIYKRNIKPVASGKHFVSASRWFTLIFGLLAILFATLASLFENLIEAVNILGSLFYGTILGIFLVAFFIKWVKAGSVFPAALIAQSCIIVLFFLNRQEIFEIGYLWYNLIGPALVIAISVIIQAFKK